MTDLSLAELDEVQTALPPGIMLLQAIGVPESGGLDEALEQVVKSLPPPGAA